MIAPLGTKQKEWGKNKLTLYLRQKHLEYIVSDLKKRNEECVSDIKFVGLLYNLIIKKNNKRKNVYYFAGEVNINSYRKIKINA